MQRNNGICSKTAAGEHRAENNMEEKQRETNGQMQGRNKQKIPKENLFEPRNVF